MGVDTQHKQYDKYIDEWKKCRDADEGQLAIHDGGEKYLDRLSGQSDQEYKAYKGRAPFYEATGRTITGLKGMIFRKPPQVDDGGMSDFIEDVTLENLSLTSFSEKVVKEALTVGRGGILVDYARIDVEGMTVAQAQALNARPFFKLYNTESIINWRADNELTEVRLKECVYEQVDEFEQKEIKQIRVLDLEEGIKYRQRIYQKRKNESGIEQWLLIETIYPLMNGQNLDFIPFVFFSPEGLGADVIKPPMTGLVNLNISHYKNAADLEHGAHYTGLPTAVISGITSEDAKNEFKIGSTVAWAFGDPSAKAYYLEFEGKGLDSLSELMKAKEDKMASLGAQMLTPSARRNEAAETAELRHMGENSILADVAMTVSDALNKALEFAAIWLGGLQPAMITLNRDFLPTQMTPQMLRELVSSWQNGAISDLTLFDNLKRGEIISDDTDFEEERASIQTDATVI